MKNKYQQAEEYIKLTPDMEQRILEKIRASRTAPVPQIQPQPPFPRRFPIPAALAACFALAVLTLFLYPRLKTGFPPGTIPTAAGPNSFPHRGIPGYVLPGGCPAISAFSAGTASRGLYPPFLLHPEWRDGTAYI